MMKIMMMLLVITKMVVREVTMMKIMMMLSVIIVVPITVILIMTILVIETTLIITYDGFGTENDCVDIVYISGTYFPWQHYGDSFNEVAGQVFRSYSQNGY